MEQVNADRTPGRVPSGAVLVGIVAVYLVIVGVIHAVATSSLGELDYGRFPDVETIVRAVVIPVGSSIVFCVAVFGVAHAVNFFLDGGGNLGQIVVTGFMGWFLYVTRRSFGSVFVPAALHGLWDFGLFSGLVTTDVYGGAALFVLAELGVAILLIVRRRRIEITS